jgi:hypothetical protein
VKIVYDPCIGSAESSSDHTLPRMIAPMAERKHDPIVLVIDFHHAR